MEIPKKREELHGKGHHVYKPLNTSGSDSNDDHLPSRYALQGLGQALNMQCLLTRSRWDAIILGPTEV